MGRTGTTSQPNNPGYDVSATVWNAHIADYVSQSETGYTQTIPYPIGAEYTVIKSGSTYYAINGSTGVSDYDGSTPHTIINNALANLTGGRTHKETVHLKGPFDITDSLEVEDYTKIILDGYVAMPSGNTNTDPVLVNADTTNGNDWIEIVGGFWSGGWAGGAVGTGGHIFQIEASGANRCSHIHIHDLVTELASDSAFKWTNVNKSGIHHIGNHPSGNAHYRKLFNFATVNDCVISDVMGSSSQTSWYWNGGSSVLINNVYIGGGGFNGGVFAAVYWDGANHLCVNNLYIDYVYLGGLHLEGTTANIFNNLHVTDPCASADPAVFVKDTDDTTFNGGFIGHISATGHTWTYGFEEDNSGPNEYTGFIIEGYATGPYLLADGKSSINNMTEINDLHSVGLIATPFPAATGVVTDKTNAQAAPTTSAVYTCAESSKMFICSNAPTGGVPAISINGTNIGLLTGTFHLVVGDTLTVVGTTQTGTWFVFPNRT